MKEKMVMKIIDMMDKKIDQMCDEQFFDLEYQFSTLKNIASKFAKDHVDCYTNLYYVNGHAIKGICLLTDGEPGGIVYHTPQTEEIKLKNPPVFQIIYTEDWDIWMEKFGFLFAPEFPSYIEEK